eukprot:CAMPEP_0195114792 /NCGR_PEP_ID=MMETSP0448-20130528/107033_1 /TAXON_ID=66468 /ORGANISM="Heterocapsa triquestra, Strain CCMP 448" /LENGTH=60 /DNA_ID=CAMNT_0040151849 /DNA_START=206 /DNA_END=388 /DNA_ORIENTATION=+
MMLEHQRTFPCASCLVQHHLKPFVTGILQDALEILAEDVPDKRGVPPGHDRGCVSRDGGE